MGVNERVRRTKSCLEIQNMGGMMISSRYLLFLFLPPTPSQKLWENIKKRVFHLLISEKPQETKMDIICPKWGKAPYVIP